MSSKLSSSNLSKGNIMEEIRFYRANEKPYGALSNLYRREVVYEGVTFQTSEHAYQAGKARKESVREWLMAAPSPSLLAMAAHGLYVWDVHPDWSKTKFTRMKEILYAKYTQHEDLKELLLSTGDKRLVEVATVDNAVNRLWGEVNGKGKNKLGELLMEVRAQIRMELGIEPEQNIHYPLVQDMKLNEHTKINALDEVKIELAA